MSAHTLETHPNVGPRLSWVDDHGNRRIWAPIAGENYALCNVVCAAGNLVRVSSAKHDFDGWRDVRDCFDFVPSGKKT